MSPRSPRRLATLFMLLSVFILAAVFCCAALDSKELAAQTKTTASQAHPMIRLERASPRATSDCTAQRLDELKQAAKALDDWAAKWTWRRPPSSEKPLKTLTALIEAKQRVDDRLERAIALRGRIGQLPPGPDQRATAKHYLAITAELIELSGRLRYTLRDAVDMVSYRAATSLEKMNDLLNLCIEHRSSIGADVMAFTLFDPPSDSGLRPFPDSVRAKTLDLIGVAGSLGSIHDLARFIRQAGSSPPLVIKAINEIRRLGLPQTHAPDQDAGSSATSPQPPITSKEIHTLLSKIDKSRLTPAIRRQQGDLLEWLHERTTRGVVGEVYRVGGIEIRSGDWMLMKNPSPYNAFTDLSPGLFTHVGVVAAAAGSDGVRRFVIVDVPERGDRVPAETVDAYLQDTLHYVFLRHTRPKIAAQMGATARSVIGNETKFDLLFQTHRVMALRGKPLEGVRIHTYCAGFLLLCALQTPLPREEFFPLPEYPAGGHLLRNLQVLGLAMGKDFVSPTGALFSSNLKIVARREPMYDPGREVKEEVYHHFGRCMVDKRLNPSPDLYHSLRQSLAGAAKFIPWLGQAMAKANNVSPYIDLESAAKAAAVIETLDQLAQQSTRAYYDAQTAVAAPSVSELRQGRKPDEIKKLLAYRIRHAELLQRMRERRVTPRQLRIELVAYYKEYGRRKLEERFFPQEDPAGPQRQ